MPIVALIIIIAAAWFISHGIYRAWVGAKCAFKGINPPWIAARQEQLTQREIRRGRRREVYGSPRTARGFVARLWGDAWEFANKWADAVGQAGEPVTPGTPGVKPAEIVPADAGASWVRQLGDTAAKGWAAARTLWDRWWLPSRRRCPWTYLTDTACGEAVKDKDATYCPQHQQLGHCVKIEAGVECQRPREGHYPYCSQHLDEEEAERAVEPSTAAVPHGVTCRQTVDYGAGFSETCGRAVPEDAETPDCGRHDRPDLGVLDTPDAPTLRTTGRGTVCTWGDGTATPDEPDHGQPRCIDPAGAGGIHCLPHQIEYGRWEAGAGEAEPSAPPPVEADASEPVSDAPVQPETTTEPEPEIPPQRPALRIVPNTEPQGDTSMSAPTQQSTGEATNTQKAKEFAQGVIDSGNVEWPKSVEIAKQQMGTVELTNDPDVVHALGAIDEAAKGLAAAGQQLLTALSTHDGATEQVSALGAKAAKAQAYKNQ